MVTWLVGGTMMNRMLIAILFVLWVMFGILTYWAWWPISPAVVIVAERIIQWEKEVAAGKTVTRELTFHVPRKVEIAVSRRMVEQNCLKCRIYELESSVKTYQPGEYTQARTINIPDIVAPGTYRIEAEASWQASPLRRGYLQLPSHIIKVTDPPTKPGISMSRLRLA